MTPDKAGLAALSTAFLFWGLVPIYFRALAPLPPLLIVSYRSVLCCVVVFAWLALRRELAPVRAALTRRATLLRLLASALLISMNWLAFVFAIDSGRVVESSLGYFITPLVNVSLGVCLLGERLRKLQWLAVSCAALGVLYIAVRAGAAPWLALVLALTFGGYGLLRKTVAVEAMTGLAAETALILPLGAAYLVWAECHGKGAFALAPSLRVLGLLTLSGVVTALPLWLFAYGARRLPFTTVGLVQYLGPSVQLVLGIFLFREPFDAHRMLGFGFIWCGLVLYSADGLRVSRT